MYISSRNKKYGVGPHILRVRQLFNAHPRTFSFCSLKNLIHLLANHLFIYAVFSYFFLYLLANNTLVCFSLFFGTACIIKKYTLNLSSKNISQYCKSPFLVYIYSYVYNRNGPPLLTHDIIWTGCYIIYSI